MFEAYEGVIDFCIVDPLVVLLVLVLHALEGLINLILVSQVQYFIVDLTGLALLQVGLSLDRRQKLLIINLLRFLMQLLFLLFHRTIEERFLVKPIYFLLIILRIKLILEIYLMLVLVVLLDPALADDLLNCAHLLLKRN